MPVCSFSTILDASIEKVFAYHENNLALKRVLPAFQHVKVIEKDDGIHADTTVLLEAKIGIFKKKWLLKHVKFNKPYEFEDHQVYGPFKVFKHIHRFRDIGNGKTEMINEITFKNFGGVFTSWFLDPMIEMKISRYFQYFHKVIEEDFKHFSMYDQTKKLRVLISGANGFVGSYVSLFLSLCGHSVYKLVRKKDCDESEIYWDIKNSKIDKSKCEGMDVVIHLSGENVGSSIFWTKKKKEKIYKSRVDSTKFLVETLNALKEPPKKFLCASAYGYYGVSREEDLFEYSLPGDGFLAKTCKDWEEVSRIYSKGIVTNLRFGIILGSRGGMLKKVLPLYKLGLGAVLGKKTDFISWISIEDVVYQIYHLMFKEVSGPVNFTASYMTNKEFAENLGNVLQRPVLFSIPSSIIKTFLGEMGKTLFLSNAKVIPKVLNDSGACFAYPRLREFLRHELGKQSKKR